VALGVGGEEEHAGEDARELVDRRVRRVEERAEVDGERRLLAEPREQGAERVVGRGRGARDLRERDQAPARADGEPGDGPDLHGLAGAGEDAVAPRGELHAATGEAARREGGAAEVGDQGQGVRRGHVGLLRADLP
jgi:hypothetical protein